MLKPLARLALVLVAAFVALPLLSCGESSAPSSSPPASPPAAEQVTYKCACGKTAVVDAKAAAPS